MNRAHQECGAWEPDVGGRLTPNVCTNARPCERHEDPSMKGGDDDEIGPQD